MLPKSRDENEELRVLAERLSQEGQKLKEITARPSEQAFLAKLYSTPQPSRRSRHWLRRGSFRVASRSALVGGVVFLGIAVSAANAFVGDPLGLSQALSLVSIQSSSEVDAPPTSEEAPQAFPIIAPERGVGPDGTPPGQGGENPGGGVGPDGTPPGQGGENPGGGVGPDGTPPGQGGENPGGGVGPDGTPPGQGGENPGGGVGPDGTPPGHGGPNPGGGVGPDGTPPGHGGPNPGGGVGPDGTPPGQGGPNPGRGGGNQ